MSKVYQWFSGLFEFCTRKAPVQSIELTQRDADALNADVLEQKGENQVMEGEPLEDMEGELTEEVKQENLEECQNCEALKEMKEKLCQEKERCFSLSLKKHDENRGLRAKIDRLEKTQRKIFEESRHLRRQNVSMRKEKKENAVSRSKLKMEKMDSQKARKQLEKRLNLKEDQTKKIFSQLKTEIEKLESRLSEESLVKEENHNLSEQVMNEKSSLLELEKAREALNSELEEKSKMVNKKDEHLAKIREEKKILESQIFGFQQECEALTEVVVKNGGEIDTLFKDNLELQRDNVKLSQRTKFQESMYKQHCLQIEDLEQRLAMFSHQRRDYHQVQQHHYFNPGVNC